MSAATTTLELGRHTAVKRSLDVFWATIALIILAPLLIAIAVIVRLDSPGPILYRHERPGKNLKPFTMLKFRTMRVGSDAIKPEEFQALGYGPQDKAKADPRITRSGRILRRFSLDELPQFINVLRGEMSIVGPRPLLGWEMDPDEMLARSTVLPGITGLWQVSGRSNLAFPEMLELDLEYVERRTALLDLMIVVKTVPAMLTRRGAY